MNRKRLEHTAGILRDIGLAALLGGAGDAALNPEAGRLAMDVWGSGVGAVALLLSTWLAGLEPARRRE